MVSQQLYHGDCLEVMPRLPAQSVDLILCDLPYGTTACKWDVVISFANLWPEYWRICKESAPVILSAVQPFTTACINSQIENFRYDWVWAKNLTSGFANARKMPLRSHENILVFYKRLPLYNPQPTRSKITGRKFGGTNGSLPDKQSACYGSLKTLQGKAVLKEEVLPRSVLEINCEGHATGNLHPTQKPVALMEYLIRTYTDEGATVLDNCMGSGTTGVACLRSGRNFIGIEKDKAIFEAAKARLATETPGLF